MGRNLLTALFTQMYCDCLATPPITYPLAMQTWPGSSRPAWHQGFVGCRDEGGPEGDIWFAGGAESLMRMCWASALYNKHACVMHEALCSENRT